MQTGYIDLYGTDSCKRESLFRAESARYSEQNARCSEHGKKKCMFLNFIDKFINKSLSDKNSKILDSSIHLYLYKGMALLYFGEIF